MATAERFAAYLRQRGLKLTRTRRLVLEETLRQRGHFDLEELAARVGRRHRGVSRATVYRTVPLLAAAGLVGESPRRAGRRVFEATRAAAHHDHLICTRCGRVIEFVEPEIERLQQRVCRRFGFRPEEHQLGIRGRCRACRAKRPSRNGVGR